MRNADVTTGIRGPSCWTVSPLGLDGVTRVPARGRGAMRRHVGGATMDGREAGARVGFVSGGRNVVESVEMCRTAAPQRRNVAGISIQLYKDSYPCRETLAPVALQGSGRSIAVIPCEPLIRKGRFRSNRRAPVALTSCDGRNSSPARQAVSFWTSNVEGALTGAVARLRQGTKRSAWMAD